jgi:YaiO family outer membrane protein
MKHDGSKSLLPTGCFHRITRQIYLAQLCLLVFICGVPISVSAQTLTTAADAQAIRQDHAGQEGARKNASMTDSNLSAMDDEKLRALADQSRTEKKWNQAIAAYQEIVRRHPDYFEDRVWIARLTAWSGDLQSSAKMMTELLRENPGDYDCRVLMADVQSWLGNYDVALNELGKLNEQYPNNAEILLRLGRISRWRGKKTEAQQYLRQVVSAHPDHAEAKEELESIKSEMHWEMRVEYAGEANSFAPNAQIATVGLAKIAEGKTNWNVEAALSRRFNLTDFRFGGEANRRVRPGSVLRASAFFSPTANVVAQQAYSTALVQKLGNRMALDAGYVHLRFRDAQVHQFAPRLDFYLRQNLWLTGSYGHSFTAYKNSGGRVGNKSAGLSLSYQRSLKDLFSLSYAWGSEPFGPSTIDRIGSFRANTWGASWRHFASPRWGFVTGYSYQKRSGGGIQQYFSFGVLKRW